jgi:hypothetical protein
MSKGYSKKQMSYSNSKNIKCYNYKDADLELTIYKIL